MVEKKMAKCKWCGKLFEKQHNNQVCCSEECQKERNREASARSSHKHYHKHKYRNVSVKAWTTLGSKGTSCTSKPKDDYEKEHKSILSEMRRLGLHTKKDNVYIVRTV